MLDMWKVGNYTLLARAAPKISHKKNHPISCTTRTVANWEKEISSSRKLLMHNSFLHHRNKWMLNSHRVITSMPSEKINLNLCKANADFIPQKKLNTKCWSELEVKSSLECKLLISKSVQTNKSWSAAEEIDCWKGKSGSAWWTPARRLTFN